MALQIKLLRVLEDRRIEPLGSNRHVDLDIRVIAAAKIDLLELVEKGEFREDLYYRLNVINVEIPPLRERPLQDQGLHLQESRQYNATFLLQT